MESPDRFAILDEMVKKYAAAALAGWEQIWVNYFVSDSQSSSTNTFLISIDGSLQERSLGRVKESDSLCRKLRKVLSQDGKEPFTYMKLIIQKSGRYEVTYGYEPVDWDSLLLPDWNFFSQKRNAGSQLS